MARVMGLEAFETVRWYAWVGSLWVEPGLLLQPASGYWTREGSRELGYGDRLVQH